MKDKKRIEILLKVTERVYSKNPGKTLIDESMIDICKEVVPFEQVFFCFSSVVGFIVMGCLNNNLLCAKDSLFLVVIKKKIM